jgi:hypothetical protein
MFLIQNQMNDHNENFLFILDAMIVEAISELALEARVSITDLHEDDFRVVTIDGHVKSRKIDVFSILNEIISDIYGTNR